MYDTHTCIYVYICVFGGLNRPDGLCWMVFGASSDFQKLEPARRMSYACVPSLLASDVIGLSVSNSWYLGLLWGQLGVLAQACVYSPTSS